MRHSYYGYFYVRWKNGRETMKQGKRVGTWLKLQHVSAQFINFFPEQSGSSIQFLSDECNGDADLIRTVKHISWKFEVVIIFYNQEAKLTCEMPCFQIGVIGSYGGHHCSWCGTAEDIRSGIFDFQTNIDCHEDVFQAKNIGKTTCRQPKLQLQKTSSDN